MRLGNRSTKKSKNGNLQKYVSISENNNFEIDQKQYVSTQLIRKVSSYLMGSN